MGAYRKPPLQTGRAPWNKGRKLWRPLNTKKYRERIAALLLKEKLNPLPLKPRVLIALKNPYNVREGQVWVNVDPRAGKLSKAGAPAVRITRVQAPYAYGVWVTPEGVYEPLKAMKVSRVRLDNFRPAEPRKTRHGGGNRGWRLKE